MGMYILKRLLLIIPTLFLILLINFIVIQLAPGGPVEQAIQKAENFQGIGAATGGRPHHRIGDRYKDLEELGHDVKNPAAVK